MEIVSSLTKKSTKSNFKFARQKNIQKKTTLLLVCSVTEDYVAVLMAR